MRSVPETHTIFAFDAEMAPAMTVETPQTVVFETLDALGGQVRHERDTLETLDFSRVNPATGPVEVAGAEPGDVLAVDVRSVDLPTQGAIITGPGLGVLGDDVHRPVSKILPIEDGHVLFNGLRLRTAPMIGVIGVAPGSGSFATGTAHRHGGNMDAKEIGPGATVYLPVFRPGALLALGDVHALMADGEVCVSACEVSAVVTVGLRLLKAVPLRWPLVEANEALSVHVSLPAIGDALREATREAVALMERALGLPFDQAYLLASLTADVGISQLVDPNKTAKATLRTSLVGPFESFCHGR